MRLKYARFTALLVLAMLMPFSEGAAAPAKKVTISDPLVSNFYEASRQGDGQKTLQWLQEIVGAGKIGLVPSIVMIRAIPQMRASALAGVYRELAYALTAPDRIEAIEEGARPILAFDALYVAARLNDQARAQFLLTYVDDAETLQFLLADRSFAPLWPQIEAQAGDHQEQVYEREVAKAREAFEKSPRDSSNYQVLAYVLHDAGRNDDVLTLAKSWRDTHDEKRQLTEEEGWATQTEARALKALGRVGEARAKYDELSALPEKRYPWVLNFAINRAVFLEEAKDHEAALAATEVATRVTAKNGTLAAKVLIARVRACALYGLGRGKEAAGDLDFVRENFTQVNIAGMGAASETLLCAGQESEVEERLTRQFSTDPSPLAGYGDLLGDRRYEGVPPSKSKRNISTFILSHDALRKAVLLHSRLIPARFTPMAVLQESAGDD